MKKRALSLALAIVLVFSFLPATLAVGEGLSNFTKINTYPSGKFTDVPVGDWYAESVKNAYEYGLVKGESETKFSPAGSVNIAAAITLACRLHSIYYTGEANFVQGDPWFQVYIDYAVKNGIIKAGEYTDMGAKATRVQYAAIMAKALPDVALQQFNTVDDNAIPDVKMTDAHAADIYRLYRAGILTGSDTKGTFNPQSDIKRAEVAALVTRMADPSLRKSVTLTNNQYVPTSAAGGITSSASVPAYSGKSYVVLNNNKPNFSAKDFIRTPFEIYSDLDSLGRCGPAYANICKETMPTEPRGEIGMVKPSGWHTVRYDGLVEGNYLYNRCHLIAYQLSGENANTKNLITGTRWMNSVGMIQFENQVEAYVTRTGNHVLYRSTPVFDGNNLVASGVQIEAMSVEDSGAGICFNVFVYNIQPGVIIDYATGESRVDENYQPPDDQQPGEDGDGQIPDGVTYVLNTNTKKFHIPTCSSVKEIKDKNKEYFYGSRDEAIAKGYSPCGRCHP